MIIEIPTRGELREMTVVDLMALLEEWEHLYEISYDDHVRDVAGQGMDVLNAELDSRLEGEK